MDVILVSHTEFGRVHNKKVVAVKDPVGVVDGVKNLLVVTDKYGAKVTLAVCPEVAPYVPTNGCEIGLHIHPGWQSFKSDGASWYVGDTYLRKYCKQSSDSTVLRDYSLEEQLEMIEKGAVYLFKILKKVPKVFVAGRWSLNNDTIRALCGHGFTHDCSAMASHKEVHFDWSKLPRISMPYRPDILDYQVAGEMPILIVPISQLVKGGCVNPEVARIYGVNWLKTCFTEYYMKKQPVFHICLHSPAMLDDYYCEVLDKLLSFIAKHKNVDFKYASEISETQCL